MHRAFKGKDFQDERRGRDYTRKAEDKSLIRNEIKEGGR